MGRIHRDKVERETAEQERLNGLKRRTTVDDEGFYTMSRETEESDKPKWKFLQKYYHKGAFYLDSTSIKSQDDVRAKDYSDPTLEDKIDKEKLPSILRVKNFGKKGRTKYTHLVDQDTTLQGNQRIGYKIDAKIQDAIRKKARKN